MRFRSYILNFKCEVFNHPFLLFILGILLSGVIFLAFNLVAYKAGEVGISFVVKRQIDSRNSTTFLSGLNQHALPYKLELFRTVEPQIIALGSSRAMQVKSFYFNSSFLNMGGSIQNFADFVNFSVILSKQNIKPELILLYLDPWWFNESRAHPSSPQGENYKPYLTTSMLFEAISKLRKGWFRNFSDDNLLGIQAKLTGDGFLKDGSMNYVSLISGIKKSEDIRFENTMKLVGDGDLTGFKKGNHVDRYYLNAACNTIKQLSTQTKGLIIVAPPYAGPVWTKMKKNGEFSYIEELYDKLAICAPKNVKIYNFLNYGDNCEFLDGMHGGDVLYARIIRDVADQNSTLKKYIHEENINRLIKKDQGLAATTLIHKFNNVQEVDFLELGCKKRIY